MNKKFKRVVRQKPKPIGYPASELTSMRSPRGPRMGAGLASAALRVPPDGPNDPKARHGACVARLGAFSAEALRNR